MARTPFLGWFAICLLALLGAQPLAAQLEPAPEAGGGGPTGEPQATTAPGGPTSPAQLPRVLKARSSEKDDLNSAALGDGLTVTVTLGSLKPTLDQVRKGCESLILFLNEIPIKGVPPDSCSLNTGEIHFTLDRTDESDQAWHILLEEPIAFTKTISVSVGPENGLAFATDVHEFKLEVLPQFEFWTYCAGLLFFLVLLFRLAMRTTLLRDTTVQAPTGKLPPYSLSRFQLAFWSFLVIAAYVFIWIITRELDTITPSVLGLLGIGSATALGANLIDTGRGNVAAAADGGNGEPAQTALPPTKTQLSRGFLNDVLSDVEGISLHRFQLFAWTLVLGVIFIASVYHGLQMPQFSPTLLGLMGISSGTYLGFKVPESRQGKESG